MFFDNRVFVRACLLVVALSAGTAMLPSAAEAQLSKWVGGTSDYTFSGNWDIGIVPALPGGEALFDSIGSASVNVTAPI